MESEKYQSELFELDKPRGPQRKLDSVFPRSRFAVTLTLERLVFISIGIIMLMVALYALGVEKGKANRRALSPLQKPIIARKETPAAPVAQNTAQTRGTLISTASAVAPQVKTAAASAPDKGVTAQAPDKPYTIVAAAFTRKDTAAAELGRLKTGGFDGFIVQSDSYFLVCAGAYSTKESASKTLARVRQRYKDAYIRSR
jgi:cell division septation protein DedD